MILRLAPPGRVETAFGISLGGFWSGQAKWEGWRSPRGCLEARDCTSPFRTPTGPVRPGILGKLQDPTVEV